MLVGAATVVMTGARVLLRECLLAWEVVHLTSKLMYGRWKTVGARLSPEEGQSYFVVVVVTVVVGVIVV